MRRASFAAIALLLVACLDSDGKPPPTPPASAPAAASAASAPPRLIEQGHYRNSNGVMVHSPAHTDTGAAPAGASAQCRDGSYSFSAHRGGTCSHHGGVAAWLQP